MRAARLALVAVVLLGTLLTASASAMESAAPGAPKALRGFELRPNESVTHTFSRTPAFAWSPVRGASCYEFELATSRTFDGSSVFWSNVSYGAASGKFCRPVSFTAPAAASDDEGADKAVRTVIAPIKIPAMSINLVLPWFTGKPYALYAHVRAITTRGATAWSRPFGFNMRWEDTPVPLPAKPGLVRWGAVEGATAYDVWYPDIRKVVRTHTNVADQREFYSFHLEDSWWQLVRWRVRPVRQVVGALPNGLPAVSYGPWSPTYATTNPAWSTGKLQVRFAVSDEISTESKAAAHQLMPAFTFTGDMGSDGREYRLFRAYAFTDRDCVNVVFRGSVVGGPAFAPRISGPLKLPANQEELDVALAGVLPSAKTETAKTFMVDGSPLATNETIGESGSVRVDLPDVDQATTRYFWTVVPVGIYVNEGGTFEYFDAESPQDACESGRMASFGKESKPAITTAGSPYVSGLSPKGRLLAQAGKQPVVYSTPLVAWRPVIGATAYEIQWSRTKYPWRARGSSLTYSTSSVLKLGAGLWHYRVRGLNAAQVGTPAMTWSAPVSVRVVRPTFQIAGG
ncbi:MAG: hypothetical protein HW413_1224 [Thermoleophilia bacterium]|nr:hypothetical protein [Thermoleophilia bacterium]